MTFLTNQNELMTKLEDSTAEIINLRRYFHQHPEVSFKEENTAKYIKSYYHDLGIETKNYGSGYGLSLISTRVILAKQLPFALILML